jgi:predicted MFS family arabinose efflux permease
VLAFSLLLNMLSSVCFSLSSNIWIMYLTRFLMGMSQVVNRFFK